jgi:hypothetical protein
MEMTKSFGKINNAESMDSFAQVASAGNMYSRGQTREKRWRIISDYFRVLDDMKGPIAVESDLPCSKEWVAEAILQELAEEPEYDLRRRLEIAYVRLESFIAYKEYRIIEDFKDASLRAQLIADMRDPTSILRSARIMKGARGERAVRLQEKIYEKMSARRLELRRTCGYCCA